MTKTLISACIATYRRPEGLRKLLASIEELTLPDHVDLEIIVVDNHPPSAANLIADHAATSRFAVHALTQPEPNISLTRNVAVAHATGAYLWFVDDDEVADPACVTRLFDALHRYDATVVFGPVIAKFEADVPDWSRPLYQRPIFATGTKSDAHRTSNTLVRADALSAIPGPFDPAYGVTGGSDSMLFRQLEEKGHRLINSDDAFVSEVVPANRASWKWLQTRSRRQGQNYGRQTVTLNDGYLNAGVGIVVAKALVLIASSGSQALLRWSDRPTRAKHLLRLQTNIGKLEGVRGMSQERDL